MTAEFWHSELPEIKRFTVGGIRFSSVDQGRAIDHFFELVATKRGGFIAATDAHGVVESQTDRRLADIINSAQMVLPDGKPIEWIGRFKGETVKRVHGHDFLEGVVRDQRAAGLRHYFYGSKPEVLSKMMLRATIILGHAAIVGSYSPPFRQLGALEDASVIAKIEAAKPDVIWIGLGLPKQEYWIANHMNDFPGSVLVGVGAAFDLFAGVYSRAPQHLQKIGLEWFVRLLQEPRRLWPRYSHVIPRMLGIMASEVWRAR
jgi:N-acetylglucosaminyldiphosphoundecaprenol N-acetyl-beta-D-mannosaminyltransferase